MTCLLISPCVKAKKLNPHEIKKLEQGEFVLHKKHIKGAPWPEITLYSYINVPAANAAAIFSHFQGHVKFIPNLLKVEIIKKHNQTSTDVTFTYNLPWPIPNNVCMTNNILSQKKANEFHLKWTFLKSNSLIDNQGHAKFKEIKNINNQVQTLFEYKSFIIPDSMFAKWLKDKREKELIETFKATIKHIRYMQNFKTDELKALTKKMVKKLKTTN